MFRKLFLTSLALIMLAGFTSSSRAAVCASRDSLLGQLDRKYSEQRQAIGLISRNGILEVFASKKGTWTVFVTNPKGMSCVVASGSAFEQVPIKIEGPEA